MTIAPQSDPNTEMQQFFEGTPPVENAQPAAVPPPPAAGEPPAVTEPPAPVDFWDQPADDDDLPPSLKGKPRREVWNTLKPALTEAHKAGFARNKYEAELEVQRQVNGKLWEQIQRGSTQPAAPQRPHEQMGIADPQQLFANPGAVLDAVPQFVTAKINELKQNFDHQLAELGGQQLGMRSEIAQQKARTGLGIDEETWLEIRPWLASVMMNNQADPTVDKNWTMAVDLYKKRAAKLFPATTNVQATPSPAGNGRPAATAAPAPKKKSSTGNTHVDRAMQEHLDVWNSRMPKEKQMTLADFADMLQNSPMEFE